MVATELHALIDVPGGGNTFCQREDRLVDHRAQNPVDGEAGAVAHGDRRLAEPFGKGHGGGVRGIAGLQAADDLQQRHHRHRIEEVHADVALGMRDRGRKLGDGDRRGVGRQHRVRRNDAVELLEDAQLDVEILGGGLDHQLRLGHGGIVGRALDAPEDRGPVRLADLILLDQADEAGADGGDALVDGGIVDVHHHHLESGHGGDLGDAIAHQASADHGNGF